MASFHKRFHFIPNYEQILEATYRGLIDKGDVVVDIGAHTGRHTAVLADLVGSEGVVHAFEPLPFARDCLVSRDLGPWVRIYPCAIADRRGIETFVFARGAPEESGFRERAYNQPHLVQPERIEVEVRPLDDFVDALVGLRYVKIDAEGAEIDCLKSARLTLERYRPFVSVEYGRPGYSAYGLTSRSLYDLATSIGYIVGDMFGAICSTVEEWEQVCDAAYWDWYLVPFEKAEEWAARVTGPAAIVPDQEVYTAPAVPKSQPTSPFENIPKVTADVIELRSEVEAMKASGSWRSWRITAPLRAVSKALKRWL